jgi:micrococcal nuclease
VTGTSRRAARWAFVGSLAIAAGLASSAAADPCKAIPDHGPAPTYLSPGSTFTGPVVYVGDGDSLCVAVGQGPESWVEVRLEDFYAPELHEPAGAAAKATLSRLAMGKRAVCRADHQSYDRMVARCEIGGRSVGDLMRAAGVQEGGRAFRK